MGYEYKNNKEVNKMGYTNYWHKYNDFTESEWKQIKEEFNYIKEVVGFLIKDESTDDIIKFNGIGDNGHEDFYLNREARTPFDKTYEGQDVSFDFCKTNEKPYDIVVWHLLTFINRICPNFAISRDR
jgi:hypothetical protein